MMVALRMPIQRGLDLYVPVFVRRIAAATAFCSLAAFLFVFATNRFILTSSRRNWGGGVQIKVLEDLYKLPKNSVDVVALGPSTVYYGFSPYDLYTEYGISAYNLGHDAASMDISYYLLRECLVTQTPSLVLVEIYKLFSGEGAESRYRQAYDSMRFGVNKLEAIYDRSHSENAESLLSYLIPILKYHTEWKSISKETFDLGDETRGYIFRGFRPRRNQWAKDGKPIADLGTDLAKYGTVGLEYLTKIVDLCKANNIPVMLFSNVFADFSAAMHNAAQAYADDQGIGYLNMNVKDVFDALDFSYQDDLYDANHINTFGTVKVMKKLGEIIKVNYDIPDRRNDPAFAYLRSEAGKYTHWVNVQRLQVEKNMAAYLAAVSEGENAKDYSVYISIRDEATNSLTDELKEAFAKCGFITDFSGKYRHSFIGVINGGKVAHEQLASSAKEALAFNGINKDGSAYSIESAGNECGNKSVTTIDNGGNLSRNARGFNIVVYDNKLRRVIDSVTWDTHAEDPANKAQHNSMTP
jgi:hypothetical protein